MRLVTGVALWLVPALAAADPEAEPTPPPPLVQPDLSGGRAIIWQTGLTQLEMEDVRASVLTERVAIDWSLSPTFSVAAALPMTYLLTSQVGSDPTYDYSGAALGNPSGSLQARGRLFAAGGRIEVAVAAGAIIPLADGAPGEDGFPRFAAGTAEFAHRPYDFATRDRAGDLVLPVRADARWSRGVTAVQGGIAVYTVVGDGDPAVDVLAGTAGVAHRAGVVALLAEATFLALPPPARGLGGGDPGGAALVTGLDAGVGTAVRGIDLRARIHASPDVQPIGGDSFPDSYALGIGLDARIDLH